MTREEFEQKVIDVGTELGTALIYDIGQLQGDDWDSLATEVAELASLSARVASKYAAYASIARRLANRQAND